MSLTIDYKEILAQKMANFTNELFSAESLEEVNDAIENVVKSLQDARADIDAETEIEEKSEILTDYEKTKNELGF